MNEIKESPQQINVLDFVSKDGSGNGLITAVAGSGKTFTLLRSVSRMTGQVAICAFNTAIAHELEEKVKKIQDLKARVSTGTCHRFGRQPLLKKFPKTKLPDKGQPSKIEILLAEVVNSKTKQKGVPEELQGFVRKAYTLARQWGVGIVSEFPFNSREAWLDLVDHFDLRDEFANADGDYPLDVEHLVSEGCNWTVRVIRYGLERCKDIIDFEDMIYATLALNLRVWQYNWILIDECQDINPTRRALIKKMLAPGGRTLFVGDPHQAIYGFTGADAKSFENIRKEFGCKDLDLTWSFRCAKAIVTFVQQWVSHIQSAPDAPEGEVLYTDSVQMWNMDIGIEDAIICRNNAPLVDLFFQFLKKGIPVHIEGKDIGSKLIQLTKRWPNIRSLSALEGKLLGYKERQTQKGLQSGKEQKAAEIADSVDAIVAVIAGIPVGSSIEDLRKRISDMFEDSSGNKVKSLTLTTSHRAKGRKWNRIFWYGKNKYNPSSFARQDWQVIQEDNLQYVTGTRAKTTLVIVDVPIPTKYWK
jgi:superfamily I DNA/RNA helicase